MRCAATNPDNRVVPGELEFSNHDNYLGASLKTKVVQPAAATHTVEELALTAWIEDKMLPDIDMKYNWFVIWMHESDWRDYFHNKGFLQPGDDQNFNAAFEAIAHRSQDRLTERAFQSSE
jgi:hypothetical protein